MTSLLTGVRYLLDGLALIRRPRLRRFVIVPLLVNTLLFAGLLFFATEWVGRLIDGLLGHLPHWLDWLRFLLWPLLAFSALVLVFYSFALVANLIAAPFNGLLAEAVERELTGRDPAQAGGWQAIIKDLVPSMLAELHKLVYFVLWAIPFGLAFLIPGVNLAAPFLWALFSAWMLALEYADYPMANHGLLFPAQRARLRGCRFTALGFGAATLALTLVPVVNFLAMPAAVAGATALWVREFGDGGRD